MTLETLIKRVGLEIYAEGEALGGEITGGYTSDLLSDVMGYAKQGEVWITLQTHKNIVGIAYLKDLAAIILIKGFKPDEETLKLAAQESITILGSSKEAFELSAEICNLLNG